MTPKIYSSLDLMPPPFAWISIPAGKVTLEAGGYVPKGGKTFNVPAFEMAKYPVTNAQFAKFVEAGGYQNKNWWTDEGWEAKEQGMEWYVNSEKLVWEPFELRATGKPWAEPRIWTKREYPLSTFNDPEYPVQGISWYEAVAFCLWLQDVTDENIILPTEQQWQYAAQGNDDRTYPWGNEWDCEKCNNIVELSHGGGDPTTSVHHYEGKGDSPFGVVDMVGNVWEWCLTEYTTGKNYITRKTKLNVVIRGGSWLDSDFRRFSCTHRYYGNPVGRDFNFSGFRLARV